MIKSYRKKPVIISAVLFNGHNWKECMSFMAGEHLLFPNMVEKRDHIMIKTLEGDMRCDIGDYLIKGIKGEFYPCKPDIFEASYEEVKP